MIVKLYKSNNYIMVETQSGDFLWERPAKDVVGEVIGTDLVLWYPPTHNFSQRYAIANLTDDLDVAYTAGTLKTFIATNTGSAGGGATTVGVPTVYPVDFGAVELDDTTTSNFQTFFDYVRDNDVVGDFRGNWDIDTTITIEGAARKYICGTIDAKNNVAISIAVSIECSRTIFEGFFTVQGSSAAAYSGKNNRIGLDFTLGGGRNDFTSCFLDVIGFTGYSAKIKANGGNNTMTKFGRIKQTACGSTGSGYTTGSAIATVSAVVNSGSANSVGQTSTMTVDAVDDNWLQFELLEINGKIHTISADPIGLDIIVYPWVDDSFTGTIYGLHGGFLIAGSDAASIVVDQIDAIRCGSGGRLGSLYGSEIRMLQTQACGIGLSIGLDEASNNLGSQVTLYNEGSNTFDFCQVSRVNTNTQIHLITGINESKWFVLEPQPATFDANDMYLPVAAFDLAQLHTRRIIELPKNRINVSTTTIVSNNIERNKVRIIDQNPIFELTLDDAYNSLWANDWIELDCWGTGSNDTPNQVTFTLNSADQTAGIRINDAGTPATSKVYSGFSNAVKFKVIYDYDNAEWKISYKGEGVTTVSEFSVSTLTGGNQGGILTLNSTDTSVNDGDQIGGIDFRSDDISFAAGDEVLSQLRVVADGAMGTGSNSKADLVYKARALETQAYTEQVRWKSTGEVVAKQFSLSALNTAPSSASDTGTLGEIRVDSTFIYVCTATDTWKRVAIATW